MNNVDDNILISTKEEEDGIVESSSNSTLASPSSSSSFDNLSDLISQLPIIHVKGGLSKYYKGKSESFTSLADVTNIKDLVKRRPRIKSCRNSRGLLVHSRNKVYSLHATISSSMKATRTTSSSSSHSNSRSTFRTI